MNKYKRYIPIIAAILIALGVGGEGKIKDFLQSLSNGGSGGSISASSHNDSNRTTAAGPHKEPGYSQWSTTTDPNINLWHIFEGEINRKGKPTGFHSRPGGQDPSGAKVVTIRDKPNRHGVYTAQIAVRDGDQWKEKFSSFFPDSLSREEVLDAIVNAYSKSPNPNAQPFEGPSGLGFQIQGYTSGRGGINTAFPIFVRN